MRERILLVATALFIILLATPILVQQAGDGTPGPMEYTFGFEPGEQDMIGDEWTTNADVPDDPNRNGTVQWSINATDRVAQTGNYSGMFAIDGLQDDGTIWLQRSIPVDGGSQYDVTVSAAAYSEQESFNVVAHMVQYAGLSPPEHEEDFPQADSIDTEGERAGLRQPLARTAGWESYNISWTTPEIQDETGHIYVGVGLSVVWETMIRFPYDDIEVTVEPVEE